MTSSQHRMSTNRHDSLRLVLGLVVTGAMAGFALPVLADDIDDKSLPQDWYYQMVTPDHKLRELEGKPAPELQIAEWIGEAGTLKELRGRVVVVDFWATWCGPCVAAIPKNIQMVEAYRDYGLHFIGIHDSRRGWERAPEMIEQREINYPVGKDAVDGDDRGKSVQAYNLAFWPTYVVIDQDGIVRGAGLRPDKVELAVMHLLGIEESLIPKEPEQKPVPERAIIPDEWLEGTPQQRAEFADLAKLNTPPAIKSESWINSSPIELGSDETFGKVVMLDFWATWCGPCIASIPKTNELFEKYKDDGLVIIAVCHPRGVERMAEVVKEHGIKFPVCADADGAIIEAYKVNSFPDYYFIDRNGKLRIIDCKNQYVEDAIKALLAEPKPIRAQRIRTLGSADSGLDSRDKD